MSSEPKEVSFKCPMCGSSNVVGMPEYDNEMGMIGETWWCNACKHTSLEPNDWVDFDSQEPAP